MHFKFLSTLGKCLSVLGAATLALTITACGGASSGTSITNTVWSASMMKNTAQASDQTGEPFRLNGRSAASVFSDSKVAELANAACDGAATRVKPLVQAGADVNGQGTQRITPLIWAMSCHNYAGISALLEQGANPNLPMAGGETAVYLAAGGSDPKILPLLLDHGGNPKVMKVFDHINNRVAYESPLFNAAQMDRFENVKLLVTRGANVYFIRHPIPGCPVCGLTPLDVSKAEIAIYLIRHSPDNKVRLQRYADLWYEYSQLTSEEQRKRAPDDYQTIAELLQLLAERGVVPKDHNGIAPPPSGSSEPQTKKDANQAKLDAFLKQREAEGNPCANGRAKLGTDGAPRCARLDPGAISATEWHQVKALSGVATQAGNKAPALYVFF
ncbi:ankyrin repeat domain-containing protein, partial [Halothiobacillus neapolitanus]